MEKEYILEYRVSGIIAVQAAVTKNPFALLYRLMDWATEYQHDIYGVTIRPYVIPF